jgi:hypothetical protein
VFRGNKVPWIAGAVLILIFVIGAVALGGKKKKTTPASVPETARALVVPADRARTVIVPPCQTPLQDTVNNAKAGKPTPGATTIELPKGQGQRTVLVPHCQPGTGSTTLDGTIPSAAVVLGDTTRRTETEGGIQADGFLARSQLVLSGGGSATTIVVPACTKKGGAKGRDAVLGAGGGGSGVAVAPAC